MTVLTTVMSTFTLVALAFTVFMIVMQMLAGRKHGLKFNLVRIGGTVLAAALAVLFTSLVTDAMGGAVGDMLTSLFGEDAGGILDAVEIGAEGVRMMGVLFIAPFIYLSIFIALRIVLSIIIKILGKRLPVLRDEAPVNKISMPLGAANGLLVALVILVPICGVFSVFGHTLGSLAAAAKDCPSERVESLMDGLGATPDELAEVGESMSGNPVVAVVHVLGTPIYHPLTTDKLDPALSDGKAIKITLEDELGHLATALVHFMDLTDALDEEDFAEEDKARLTSAADSMIASDWMRHFMAELLSSMADSWLEGKPMAGIERPETDANTAPTFDSLLRVLATETPDTLEGDLHTIMEVLGDFKKSGLLSDGVDPADMIVTISSSGLMDETLATIEENDHMKPVAAEIRALSVRLVGSMLGVDELKSGKHDALMGDVAGRLTEAMSKSGAERDALLQKSINEAFKTHDYDVPENVALQLSGQIIEDLDDGTDITGDELKDYLVERSENGTLPVAVS